MQPATSPTGIESDRAAPPAPARVPHNYALPEVLAAFAEPSSHPSLNVPQSISLFGFSVIDRDHNHPDFRQGALIWLGVAHGGDGRWLTADEAMELAGALRLVATVQKVRSA